MTGTVTPFDTTRPITVRLEGVMKIGQRHAELFGFTLTLFCALTVFVPRALTQQPPQPQLDITAPYQITFVVPIDSNSVNALIQIMNSQVRIGRKNFIILLSSQGGEVLAGLTAYNYLHGLGVNLTTFNIGQVDSAANLVFCAGGHRYALPESRFLIHSAFTLTSPGSVLNASFLDGQFEQVKSMNRLMAQVIETTTKKNTKEIEDAVQGQAILTPKEAVSWGLVDEVRSNFVTPNAVIADILSTPTNREPSASTPNALSSQPSSGSPLSSTHQ